MRNPAIRFQSYIWHKQTIILLYVQKALYSVISIEKLQICLIYITKNILFGKFSYVWGKTLTSLELDSAIYKVILHINVFIVIRDPYKIQLLYIECIGRACKQLIIAMCIELGLSMCTNINVITWWQQLYVFIGIDYKYIIKNNSNT